MNFAQVRKLVNGPCVEIVLSTAVFEIKNKLSGLTFQEKNGNVQIYNS